MIVKNLKWMGVVPVALLLSGCFNADYAELCGKKLATSLQTDQMKVLDSKWSKIGRQVRVSISFNATDMTGATTKYNGNCRIEGDKVVSHSSKTARSKG